MRRRSLRGALTLLSLTAIARGALAQERTEPDPAAAGDDAATDGGTDRDAGAPDERTLESPRPRRLPARMPEPIHPIDPTPPLAILPTSEDALMDPRMARSWGTLPSRWFAATTVDIGFVYARPRLSVGYGRPFTSWFGVDFNPTFTGAGLGAYAGLRLEFPFIDIRAGTRFWNAYNHAFMQPRESYARLELERESGPTARYFTHEVEADMSIPAGPGNVLGRASGSYLTGAPAGTMVFEQGLRVIVEPPLVWRLRVGYAVRLGQYSQHAIGAVVDFLDVPKRDDSRTIRVGPVLRIVFSRRVELRGSFVVTAYSPDRIGLVGGDFTELGIRYRWATEPSSRSAGTQKGETTELDPIVAF